MDDVLGVTKFPFKIPIEPDVNEDLAEPTTAAHHVTTKAAPKGSTVTLRCA